MIHCPQDRFSISYIQLNRLDLGAAYLFKPMNAPCYGENIIAMLGKKLSGGSSYTA
jgi:hypothetical protein